MKDKYVIVSNKPWSKTICQELSNENLLFSLINNKIDLNQKKLNLINPKIIFFPHWSYLIPSNIYNNFECIIFHMTDLPYGKGGSPLQNLIVRGKKETKISALKCTKGLDSGPIYLKKKLLLNGSAQEIYEKANKIIKKMILQIINKKPEPKDQKGKATIFKRRNPEDGNIIQAKSIEEIYDFIRMLDAETYPNAFFNMGEFKFNFSDAIKTDNSITAKVKISKKSKEK